MDLDFAEICSKAAYMPQSAVMCRYDSTLHHALAVCYVVLWWTKKTRQFWDLGPLSRSRLLTTHSFPGNHWERQRSHFLRFARGLEVRRGWMNPLTKELQFTLSILNYALDTKPEEPQNPLQLMILCGHCHPHRECELLIRLQMCICLGSES